MADEAENFEPKFKRPRITLESSEPALQTEKGDQATEETRDALPGHIQKKDLEERLENVIHVVDASREETSEIREETNLGTNSSDIKSSYKGGVGPLKDTGASEKDVGILEFVSNLPGFHGVLKQRFTDFIVRERDLEGNLVRLTDTSVPQDAKTKEFDLDVLSQEEKEKIQQVIDDEEKNMSVTLAPDDDKEHRRLVHRAIRENFSNLGKLIYN